MRLTTFSDYSLRVMIYLGTCGDRRVSVGEIASAYGISKNHLMKVVLFLADEGYIETARGKRGGVRLKMQPERVWIGKLLRKSEAGSVLVECFSEHTSDCCIQTACRLRGALHKAVNAFYAVLNTYTLADLLANRAALAPLLQISPQSERK
ncbi:MAG: Rrf2 family transcriptional regulator [Thiogranum sp.]|jgi:Rrf2 family nitric oxide-sensitive transcriptional repressor|nr:Rrf2 family transcriptional regulator [Thiogranum sp.]